MTKNELLENIRTKRAEWDGALAAVPKGRTQEPVIDHWSVKDLIAHVMWSEREMVGMLRTRALVGSDLWNLSQDERNAAIYEENRARALDDVLEEALRVYDSLVHEIEQLSDVEVNDPRQFRDMPLDWIPWRVIAGNTYIHYPEHAAQIREWLET